MPFPCWTVDAELFAGGRGTSRGEKKKLSIRTPYEDKSSPGTVQQRNNGGRKRQIPKTLIRTVGTAVMFSAKFGFVSWRR